MKKITAAITGAILCVGPLATAEQKTTIRFGHFPNITHAQGVIAHALSRQGKGWFEQRLGPKFDLKRFNDQELSYGLLPLKMIAERIKTDL